MSAHQLIVPSNPTPNGDLHIGHIAGPYLGADVLRRAAVQRGERASVLLGTAWQNTHVMLAARRQGRGYLDVAADFAGQIERSFAAARIGYDVMLRHGDIGDIERVTKAAWHRLRADGAIVLRDAAAQHCGRCRQWRFQGYVEGRCPHCGSGEAAGIDCEGCGLYHDDAELIDPVCAVCGTATTPRPLRRAFLDLEPQRAWFESYLASTDLGAPVAAFASAVLARPLPSVAMTFAGELGIPVDEAGLSGQRIYPAFELAPRYVVMLRRLRAAGIDPGPDARMTMIFGCDNAFERVFLFPAVLRALGSAPAPAGMAMTFFYLLDGLKFSTSRRHLVCVGELAETAGADALRLYVAATRPELAPTDFNRSAFAGSAQVAAVRRLERLAASPGVDAGSGAGTATDVWPRLASAAASLHDAMTPRGLSCVRAAEAVLELAALACSSAVGGDVRAAVLHCLVNGAGALIPDTAARLRAAFAVPVAIFDGRVGTVAQPAGA